MYETQKYKYSYLKIMNLSEYVQILQKEAVEIIKLHAIITAVTS